MGYFKLFQVVLARKLRVPPRNVRALVTDTSNAGLKAAYEHASLPQSFYNVVQLYVEAVRAIAAKDRIPVADIQKVSLVKLLDKMHECRQGRDIEHFDYVVSMIRHHQQEG